MISPWLYWSFFCDFVDFQIKDDLHNQINKNAPKKTQELKNAVFVGFGLDANCRFQLERCFQITQPILMEIFYKKTNNFVVLVSLSVRTYYSKVDTCKALEPIWKKRKVKKWQKLLKPSKRNYNVQFVYHYLMILNLFHAIIR